MSKICSENIKTRNVNKYCLLSINLRVLDLEKKDDAPFENLFLFFLYLKNLFLFFYFSLFFHVYFCKYAFKLRCEILILLID